MTKGSDPGSVVLLGLPSAPSVSGNFAEVGAFAVFQYTGGSWQQAAHEVGDYGLEDAYTYSYV